MYALYQNTSKFANHVVVEIKLFKGEGNFDLLEDLVLNNDFI
jgi:hypothetical protein